MKVDQRVLNYEIHKNLPKSSQKEVKGTEDKQALAEQKASEKKYAGQQDTVVHLSPTIKDARLVEDIISSQPDIRTEKVSFLKSRIESGEYQIDHATVADKLVESVLDDLS